MFVTDQSMGIVDLARAVEERGLDSLYVPEHSHIPTSRRTPHPDGIELPAHYKRSVDPFVALAAAAAVTTRLRVGTSVCLVAQRDPIHTAKEVATLDTISGGRFVFGVGIGWNQDEAEDHGVDFARRRSILREKVLAMQKLWAEDVASFQGEFVKLPPCWMWPKPVQRPHPPILVGGAASPKLFAHVAEYADGWMPIGGSGLGEAVPALRRAFEQAGRSAEAAKLVVCGSALDDAGKLAHFRAIGVGETVGFLPSAGRDAVLPVLDRYAAVVSAVRAG
jgi:probable F420-dependent oxidoreductase